MRTELTTSGPGKTGFGILRIGDRLISVPFGNLVEVCVVPDVSKMMVPDGPLLGAFDLRGSLVPLIDLEALSGLPGRDRASPKAVVLQHEGRITAVALDEIVTLTNAEPSETRYGGAGKPDAKDTAPGQSPLFPAGFMLDGRMVNCLDAGALFARPEVPSIANTRTGTRTEGVTNSQKYLIVSVGGASFGIGTQHISATLPRQAIDRSGVDVASGICLGFIDHQGWKVPVVDTSRTIGLGKVAPIVETEIVVLRFSADSFLALAVDSTDNLAPIPTDRMTDACAVLPNQALVPKVFVRDDDRQVFIIDFEALTERPDLQEISRLSLKKTDGVAARRGTARQAGASRQESLPYLVFDAGGKRAVRADQVSRILKMPERIVTSPDTPPEVLGFFSLSGRSVPLVSLTGAHAPGDGGFVLLFSSGDHQVGFAAHQICSIVPSELRMSGEETGGNGADLVQVRFRGERTLLEVADLDGQARAILGLAPDRMDGAA